MASLGRQICLWGSLWGLVLLWGCATIHDSSQPQVESPLNRGVSLYTSGDYERAIVAFKQALQAEPNSSKAHYNLGLVYLQQGHLQKAIEAFQKAIQFDSTFASAYNNLGIALSQKGDVDGAIVSFRQAIRRNSSPNHTNFHFNLGIALWRKGDLTDAMKEFRIILHYEPDHHQARKALDEIQRGRIQPTLTRTEA